MKSTFFPWRKVMALLAVLQFAHPAFAGQLISSRSDGSALNGASSEPSISGDGRFVVFSTQATLNASDANGKADVFLKDRQTGTLRRISNELGGDQPMISANGRYVIFRALDTFPKIRFVDLESNEPARTVSYPFNGNSFRYADSGTISPDGAFVAFSFRPIPGFNNNTNPLLCVNSTFNSNRLNATDTAPQSFNLDTLARSSMTRDGGKFFFETRDSLLPADTNGVVDVYMATPNDDFVVRLSATENGLPETGAAYDPVVTPDGSAVFFISNRRLRVSDNDGRATIYRSTSGDGFATPQPLLMSVQPVSISPQGTSNGQFLVFLGRSASGVLRPYIWRASDGAVREIASAATASTGEPSISADNGDIVFASSNSFAGGDQNGISDVYLVQNPFGARLAKPVVTLAGVSNGTVIIEGNGLNLTGSASGGGGILFTTLEVDGVEVQRTAGGAVNRFTVLSRGVHTIRAKALSLANVPGQSAQVQVTVVPAPNTLRITGPRGLTRLPQADGSTAFSASVRIDNTFGTASGALQILVVEIPNAAAWEFFGNTDNVTPAPEQVIGLVDIPSLPGGGANVTTLSERVTPATVVGDGYQGSGSTVVARLRELVGGVWFVRDQIDLIAIRPALNEETPGPNGGIPLLTSNTGNNNFTPAVFQGVQVQGSPTVVERSSIAYSAIAIYSNGNQPCRPDFSVVNGGSFASISPLGLLTVGDVSTPTTIGVRASFGGRTNTMSVTVTPISPVISVIPVAPLATESGTQGSFKILRTPVDNSPLTVSYRMAGSATAGQDYTALSGTAVTPAGVASVRIQVVPINDATFEGRERATLVVLPSAKYRRNASSAATVVIEDNEPGQPDATIRASGGGAEIGAFQIEFNFPGSEQRAFLRSVAGTPSGFTARFINRTNAAENFTISGGSDILGCSVRYFFGSSDVTAQVVAGTFAVNNIQPGGQFGLLVRLTTSAATPLGAVIRCPIRVDGNVGSDTVEAMVRRIR